MLLWNHTEKGLNVRGIIVEKIHFYNYIYTHCSGLNSDQS